MGGPNPPSPPPPGNAHGVQPAAEETPVSVRHPPGEAPDTRQDQQPTPVRYRRMSPYREPPTPDLPAVVEATITGYTPSHGTCTAEEWALIADFSRGLVRRLQPQTVAAARQYLTRIARFAAHRRRAGTPLNRSEMFTHVEVEEQITVWRSLPDAGLRNAGLTPRSLNSEASFLRAKAPLLNPLGGYPPRTTRGQRADLQAPYDTDEISCYRELFWGPGSETAWALHRTLLALGHGAGAVRSEVIALTTDEIIADGDGMATVQLPHPDGSTVAVPIAPPYATWLLQVADQRGPGTTLLPTTGWSNSGELDRPVPPYLPPLTLTRLRNTWLTERLAAGVSPRQLRHYGRYATYGFMTSLAPYIPDLPEADLAQALIGQAAP